MCGILGYVGDIPQELHSNAHTILQNIFISSQKRGKDAAGFSAIHLGNKNLITEKRPITSTRFVDKSIKFRTLSKQMPHIFVGHTRLSTSGDPARGRNNHPFNSQRYSIVHNGTIPGWKKLVKERNLNLRTETDSEIILRLIEEADNVHEGVQHLIDNLPSAASIALAVIDRSVKDNPSLFLFRKDNKPISVLFFKEYRSIFFASEEDFLKTGLRSLAGNSWESMLCKESSIENLPPWQSIEIKLADGLPVPVKEVDIKKKTIMGFSTSSTTSSSSSSKPVIALPTSVVSGQSRLEPNTLHMLKNIDKDTRDKSIKLMRTVKSSSPIIESIRKNMFMSNEEMDHFKEWMHKI